MHIEERKVTVREVTEGYFNDAEEGVVGYDDQLDIRPKYQREFVYKDKQCDEVIRTVMKGLPLNVMYWVDRGEQYEDDPDEPRYEVLDGQQRTISLCEYVDGSFSVDDRQEITWRDWFSLDEYWTDESPFAKGEAVEFDCFPFSSTSFFLVSFFSFFVCLWWFDFSLLLVILNMST